MAQDEDLARAWLAIPEDERPKGKPRLSQFSWSEAAIHDRLAELFTLTLNVNSKSGGHKPHYMEKPETAAQRLEAEQELQELHDSSLGGWMD